VPPKDSITIKELASLLLDYAESNSVKSIVAAVPYLEALAHSFGNRDVRNVTAKELHAFHKQICANPAVKPLLTALEKKAQRWETIYACRAQGLVQWLQWESERPVRALVQLFERPGFRPQRVLELGCGDGVNAIFMASRGCQVTAVDISRTALKMAREKQRLAGVDVQFVEGDVFKLDPQQPYDFVFDRGMFHHVQVFHFEDYKNLVADRLAPNGHFHLICHHVSTRPTVLLDCLCGSVGKLLGFLSGSFVEAGTGFTADELREIFSDRFRFESMDLIWDDNNRPFCFESSFMQRIA
jgi:2-polyprenyl-3-methyl-5-hydroxy-6-metoxy-1,4-benzoquinol methylase